MDLQSIALGTPVSRKGHRRLRYGYISKASSDSATLNYRVIDRKTLATTAVRTATMNLNATGFILGSATSGVLGTSTLGKKRILSDSVELMDSGDRIELEIVHNTTGLGPELVWLAPMIIEESN
jgi:hypothetical protein